MIFSKWNFKTGDIAINDVTSPCSFYSILLENGKMEDPFWRDNEYAARDLCRADCSFETVFTATAEDLSKEYQTIRLANIDTVCDIYLNGKKIAHTENMHRRFVFDVKGKVKEGENTLLIYINSPILEMERLQLQRELLGLADSIHGTNQLRKAFCMSGWDWGPQLPDMGIYGKCEFLCFDSKIEEVEIRQKHRADGSVILTITPEITGEADSFETTVSLGDKVYTAEYDDSVGTVIIDDPELWWPNGYGAQTLYTVETKLSKNGEVLDTNSQKIGLRTLTVHSLRDHYGKDFTVVVNGVSIFCMGANYIPEDNLFPRITREVLDRLTDDSVKANYNMLRIWGGGYYPSDYFYDLCDQKGLLVWQDFMYACGCVRINKKIRENLSAEIRDVVKRIRNHASLTLFAGNNEIEQSLSCRKDGGVWNDFRMAYMEIFHKLMPDICEELAPDTYYTPSSPTSNWNDKDPNDTNWGDSHYWDVWHGLKDFTDYRNYYFRFLSEFGFQSFPTMKTIESFTLPEDRNIFTRVMESHQKNGAANSKILDYMARNYRYVAGLTELCFVSQVNQADAMKYGVEHLRRNRGRCMGALYWQINDCWPVASWSSIDYFGRWKALHYYARRFFAPVLMSVEDAQGNARPRITDVTGNNFNNPDVPRTTMRINISNETMKDFKGTVKWFVRDNDLECIASGEVAVNSKSLTANYIATVDIAEYVSGEDRYSRFFVAELYDEKGEFVSKQVILICKPKHFEYKNAKVKTEVKSENGKTVIYLSADSFVHNLEISFEKLDTVLSDNFFSITDKKPVRIEALGDFSVEEIEKEIKITSINSVSQNH